MADRRDERQVSWAHRMRVVEAALQLVRVSVELYRRRAGGTVELLGRVRTDADATMVSAAQLAMASRVGFAVSRAADRLPWHPTCLRQAIAAQRMLRCRGIPARLHLGISTASSSEAHAWVTVGARQVIGHAAPGSFVPLAGFE
jgi:hypothetical protein